MSVVLLNQVLNKVAYFEGFRSKPYRCPSGVLTIGYGHTGDVKQDDHISIADAQKLLRQDFNRHYKLLYNDIGEYNCSFLSDGQLYALTDLVFNIGIGKFKTSTLRHFILAYCDALQNHTNFAYLERSIADNFRKWKYYRSNGVMKVSSGLVARREFEVNLFLHNKVY